MYHLSTDSNLAILTPKIPKSVNHIIEDSITPRICFAPTINCCLNALCVNAPYHYNMTYFNSAIAAHANDEVPVDYAKATYHTTMMPELNIDIDKALFEDIKLLEAMALRTGIMSMDYRIDLPVDDKITRLLPYYYVYVPVGLKYSDLKQSEVYDASITHEYWVTDRDVEVERVGGVYVIAQILLDNLKVKYKDPRTHKSKSMNIKQYEYYYRAMPNDYEPTIEKYKKSFEKENEK